MQIYLWAHEQGGGVLGSRAGRRLIWGSIHLMAVWCGVLVFNLLLRVLTRRPDGDVSKLPRVFSLCVEGCRCTYMARTNGSVSSSTTTQFCQSTSQYTAMASTQREIAQLMADVTPWYKDPGRRKLYALLLIALLSSATNGYDGYVYCHNFP